MPVQPSLAMCICSHPKFLLRVLSKQDSIWPGFPEHLLIQLCSSILCLLMRRGRHPKWQWQKTCGKSDYTQARANLRAYSVMVVAAKKSYFSDTIVSTVNHPPELFQLWFIHILLCPYTAMVCSLVHLLPHWQGEAHNWTSLQSTL